MAKIGEDIRFAKNLIMKGGIVGVPTETVYGLAGNALDENSILKIYSAKDRPKFDPLIAHTDSLEKILPLIDEFPEKARILADSFWPGPLTLLLPRKRNVPDLLTSGLSRVAFRIPNHPLTLELLSKLYFPLAAPSANPFGFVSPTQASHVNDQLGDKVDYILNGGKCKIGVESTVVGFDNGEVVVHRFGGLGIEEIEKRVGSVRVELNKSSNPDAPGMMKSHYSPGVPVVIGIIREKLKQMSGKKVGVISFCEIFHEAYKMRVLSPTRDLNQSAKNLFRAMRELRETDVEVILTEKFPEKGIGRAINDRLARAAAQ